MTIAALTEEVREGFGDVAEMMKEVGDRFDRVDHDIREAREGLAHATEGLAGKLSGLHRGPPRRLHAAPETAAGA
jgi:hypothetical protein